MLECWSLAAKSTRGERVGLDVAKLTRAAVEAREMEEGRWRGRPAAAKMTCLFAATLGHSGGVAAGRVSGGLGVALPCASAKCSGLFSKVFGDCSWAGCKLSPRDRAIIRELNQTALAQNFLETGGIGRYESCEKSGVLHLVHITYTSPSPLCYL